ncbi:MAG: hypothetical protein ACJATA_000893 [Sphingobacteriales bacterium]|jgi:hypothetical protein
MKRLLICFVLTIFFVGTKGQDFSSAESRAEFITNDMASVVSFTPEQREHAYKVNMRMEKRIMEIETRYGENKKAYKKSVRNAEKIRLEDVGSTLSKDQRKALRKNRRRFRKSDWKYYKLRRVEK